MSVPVRPKRVKTKSKKNIRVKPRRRVEVTPRQSKNSETNSETSYKGLFQEDINTPGKKKPSLARAHASATVQAQEQARKTSASAKRLPRDELGYALGSDMHVAVQELLKGGEDRREISDRVAKAFGKQLTRNGRPKPVSTIINNALRQLTRRGYRIEASWKLVPPEDGFIVPRRNPGRPPRKPADATEQAGVGMGGGQAIPTRQKASKRVLKPKPRRRIN